MFVHRIWLCLALFSSISSHTPTSYDMLCEKSYYWIKMSLAYYYALLNANWTLHCTMSPNSSICCRWPKRVANFKCYPWACSIIHNFPHSAHSNPISMCNTQAELEGATPGSNSSSFYSKFISWLCIQILLHGSTVLVDRRHLGRQRGCQVIVIVAHTECEQSQKFNFKLFLQWAALALHSLTMPTTRSSHHRLCGWRLCSLGSSLNRRIISAPFVPQLQRRHFGTLFWQKVRS